MRRLSRIVGRTDDMLIIRGVNVYPSQIEELLLRLSGIAPHYQLELTRAGYRDELVVHVECVEGAAADVALRTRIERDLEGSIKAMIGISAQVRVADPGAIPRSAGKARRVIDRRQNG